MKKYKHVGIVGVTAVGAALCYKEIVVQGMNRFKRAPEISVHAFPQNDYNVDGFDELTNLLVDSIENLKKSGADFAIIPANTVHYVYEDVKAVSPLPLISIIDIAINECVKQGKSKVSVLGTFSTMQFSLYRDNLKNRGIELVEPTHEEKVKIDKLIAEELLFDTITDHGTKLLVDIIERLKSSGSQLVILACTELPIIISNENSPLPCIDTTRLLAEKALLYASNQEDDNDETDMLRLTATSKDSDSFQVKEPEEPEISEVTEHVLPIAALEEAIRTCVQLHDQGNYAEAKATMEKSVKQYPDSAAAHAWYAISIGRLIERSSVLNKMRLLPLFERETLKALEISPYLLIARRVNGMRLLNTPEGFGGNIKKAIDEFQYCLDNGLEDDDLYFSLGQAYIKLKDVAEGKKAFHASLNLNADHQQAKKHLKMLEIN